MINLIDIMRLNWTLGMCTLDELKSATISHTWASAQAVEQLHNTKVGDGELIEAGHFGSVWPTLILLSTDSYWFPWKLHNYITSFFLMPNEPQLQFFKGWKACCCFDVLIAKDCSGRWRMSETSGMRGLLRAIWWRFRWQKAQTAQNSLSWKLRC